MEKLLLYWLKINWIVVCHPREMTGVSIRIDRYFINSWVVRGRSHSSNWINIQRWVITPSSETMILSLKICLSACENTLFLAESNSVAISREAEQVTGLRTARRQPLQRSRSQERITQLYSAIVECRSGHTGSGWREQYVGARTSGVRKPVRTVITVDRRFCKTMLPPRGSALWNIRIARLSKIWL